MKTLKIGLLVLGFAMVSTSAFAQTSRRINASDPNLSHQSKISCPHRDGSNRYASQRVATNDTVRHDKRIQSRRTHQ